MNNDELVKDAQREARAEIKSEIEGSSGELKGKPKKDKKALRLCLDALIYVVIVGGIVYGLPKFFSWYLHTNYPMAAITSGSMWPVLKTGDLVFIEGAGKGNIVLGDIIVFKNRTNNTLTIHRVVKLTEDKITTKGDANFSEDSPVDYADVIGKTYNVFGGPARIPFLGSVTVYASKFIKQG